MSRFRLNTIVASVVLLSVLIAGCDGYSGHKNKDIYPYSNDVVTIPEIEDRNLYCLEHNYPEHDFVCNDGRYYDETGREVLFSGTVFEDTDTHYEVNDYYISSYLKEQNYLATSKQIVRKYGFELANYPDDDYRYHRPYWDLAHHDYEDNDLQMITDMSYELLNSCKTPLYRAPERTKPTKREINILSNASVSGIQLSLNTDGRGCFVNLSFNLRDKSKDELMDIIKAQIEYGRNWHIGGSTQDPHDYAWPFFKEYSGTSISIGNNSFLIPENMNKNERGQYKFDSSDKNYIKVDKYSMDYVVTSVDDRDEIEKAFYSFKAYWRLYLIGDKGAYMNSSREDLGPLSEDFKATYPACWFRIYEPDGSVIYVTYFLKDKEYIQVELSMSDYSLEYAEAYDQIRYSFE